MISEFLRTVAEATERIALDYFQVARAGIKDRAYLERVYCYEFYHQFRAKQIERAEQAGRTQQKDILSGLILNGEPDKSAYPLITGKPKPDFIMHLPRTMEHNFAVMEVKRRYGLRMDVFRGDLKKLSDFISPPANYYLGVYLIFGEGKLNGWRNKAKKIAATDSGIKLDQITLLHHTECGKPAEKVEW